MIEGIVEKVKGFLMNPAESFRRSRTDSVGAAYRYFVVLLVIYTILSAIVAVAIGMFAFNDMIAQLATTGMMGAALAGAFSNLGLFVGAMIVFVVYLVFFIALLGIFLKGLALHAFVLLMGGEKGYQQTLKTTMYATTPFLLLGWIPYVSIIGAIWYIILLIIGIRETQEMDTGKALLVIAIPLVLILILALLGGVVIAALMQGILAMIPFI
jgi:hypothetical protein